MSDTELKDYLPAHGDRLAVKSFCNKVRRTSLIEKLRKSINNHGDKMEEPQRKRNFSVGKETRIIEIAWQLYCDKTKTFKKVRGPIGGNRRIPVKKLCKSDDIKAKALDIFFPDGVSVYGKIDEFESELFDYKSHKIQKDLDIGEMYSRTGMTSLRFYLGTTKKVRDKKGDDYEPPRSGIIEATHFSMALRTRGDNTNNTDDIENILDGYLSETTTNTTTNKSLKSLYESFADDYSDMAGPSSLTSSQPANEGLTTFEVDAEASLETSILLDIFENENSAANVQFPKSILVLRRGHIFEELLDAVKTHKYDDFRQIQIEMILPNGTAEIASDTGGVLRDAVAEFWETFYAKCSIGTDLKIPYLRHDFQKEEWQTIGKILIKGLEALDYFPVKLAPVFMKQCFNKFVKDEEYIRDFLKYVCRSDALLLQTATDNFEEVDLEELLEFCSNYDAKWKPSKENIKTLIKQIAMEELIQKPAFVKQCFALECESIGRTTDLDYIYKKLEPSDKNIIALFEIHEDDLSSDELQVYKHLKKFIKEVDQKVRCAFLRFCTGSDLPIQKIRLEFTDSAGFKRVPIAHTCSGLVQIPSTYESYVTFRCEWNNLLSSNIWVMDII